MGVNETTGTMNISKDWFIELKIDVKNVTCLVVKRYRLLNNR